MKIKKFIKKHLKLIIILAIVLVLVLTLLFKGSGSSNNFVEETPQNRDIYTYKSFVGNIEPSTDTSVISKVSQQVTQLLVEQGDTVQKGDVIAVIDSSTVQQNISKTQLSLSTSNTSNYYTVSDAQRNYDNYKEALDNGLNSTLKSAQNNKDSAYNTLQQAKQDYDDTVNSINNGTYSALQAYSDAISSAQNAYNEVVNIVNLSELQTAYDNAKLAYDNFMATYTPSQDGSPTPEDETLQQLKTAYEQAQVALESAQAQIASAQSALDNAKSTYNTSKQEILDAKQNAIDNAQTSYEAAIQNYDSTKLSVDQQLKTYEANLNKTKNTTNSKSTELELQHLKDSLKDYTITAPCSGTITELNISEGSMVTSGSTIATISNLNSMKVSINIDEYSILDISEGSEVTILVDSIDKTYTGTIRSVSDTATLNNGVSYFEATIDFIADEYVRSGMSVEVRLTNVDKKDILTISTDAIHYNDDNTAYVIVKSGDTQETRTVELGASDGNYVEIVSELDENDIVLVAAQNGIYLPEPASQTGE